MASRLELILAYAALGRWADAKAEAARIVRAVPTFSVADWMHAPNYRDPAWAEREAEVLRAAGLPG